MNSTIGSVSDSKEFQLFLKNGIIIEEQSFFPKEWLHKDESSFQKITITIEENCTLRCLNENVLGTETLSKSDAVEFFVKTNSLLEYVSIDYSKSGYSQSDDTNSSNSKLIDLSVNLIGKNAQAKVYGTGYHRNSFQVHHQTRIVHKESDCVSEQLYKFILSDQAQTHFRGTVVIDKNIVNAQSSQLNKNLLLSDKAQVFSQPVLQIFSDDVKATHGSTTSQLNEEEVFYLESRSINKDAAKEILSRAFISEVAECLSSETLKNYTLKRLEAAWT